MFPLSRARVRCPRLELLETTHIDYIYFTAHSKNLSDFSVSHKYSFSVTDNMYSLHYSIYSPYLI